MELIAQLAANGLASGCALCLVALGYALIYNTTRIFHVAHGATYVVGAYIAFFGLQKGMSLPLAALCGLAGGAATGLGTELLVYRPLLGRKAPLLVSMLSSIGVYTVLVNLTSMCFGGETRSLSSGTETTYRAGSVVLSSYQLAEIVAAVAVTVGLLLLLKQTRLGLCVRALRDNPTASAALGVDTGMVRLVVFASGSALAALAAILSAADSAIDPNVGMPALLSSAVALTIGGIGTFHGAVVGALSLGFLQSLVSWGWSSRWSDTVTYAVLIVFLVFRPQGLLGTRQRVEELG